MMIFAVVAGREIDRGGESRLFGTLLIPTLEPRFTGLTNTESRRSRLTRARPLGGLLLVADGTSDDELVFQATGLRSRGTSSVTASSDEQAPDRVAARGSRDRRLSVLRQAGEPRLEASGSASSEQARARRPRSIIAARHDRKIIIERGSSAREIEDPRAGHDEPVRLVAGDIGYDAEWYEYSTRIPRASRVSRSGVECRGDHQAPSRARGRGLPPHRPARAWPASNSSSSATATGWWSTRSTRFRGSRDERLRQDCGRPRSALTPIWSIVLIELALERHQSKGTAGERVVRAAGRRGAGAPPADGAPFGGCARCRPSRAGPRRPRRALLVSCALQAVAGPLCGAGPAGGLGPRPEASDPKRPAAKARL